MNEQYINGSDLLVLAGSKAIGHCTTHTATFSTETKDVAVKPAASATIAASSLYKNKRVSGLSVQVKADGLCVYGEAEQGFKELLAAWKLGTSLVLKLFGREDDDTPYLSGNFIISSLEQTAPAGEDATYSVTFDNDGAPTIDDTKYPVADNS